MFPVDDGGSAVHIRQRFYAHMEMANNFKSDEPENCKSDESEELVEDQLENFDVVEDEDPGAQDTTMEDPKPASSFGDELGLLEGQELNQAALAARVASPISSDESSTSSNESESPSKAFELLASQTQVSQAAAEAVDLTGLWRVRGGCFHLESLASETHFKCGTTITSRAFRQVHEPRFFSPQCKKCFK